MKKHKHYDSMWDWIKDLFTTDPLQEQQARVEDAARSNAQAVADVEAERVMCDFYTGLVQKTNHETHWWEYADAKQKQADHHGAWARAVTKAQEAAAKLEAEQARLVSLQEKR